MLARPSRAIPRVAAARPALALATLLAAPLSLGCSDVLGFSGFHAVCGPETDLAAGGRVWATRFGDAAFQEARGVAVDPEGDVLVTGSFAGTLDAGGDPLVSADKNDAFVLKLDPDGQPLYAKRFGGKGDQDGVRVATDKSGNVFLTGRFNGDIDFCGHVLTSEDQKGTGGQGAVDTDVFLAKLDPAGDCVWSAAFGGAFAQASTGLAVDADGDVYVTGSFVGALDFGGKCGALHSLVSTDTFVAAFSPAGECLWTRQQDFGGADAGRDIAVDASKRVWVIGQCTQAGVMPCDTGSGLNVLLTRIEPDDLGTSVFPGVGDGVGLGVALSDSNSLAVTGQFASSLDILTQGDLTGDSAGDMFLANILLGPNGELLPTGSFSAGFGGAGVQTGRAVTVSGEVIAVAGSYERELGLGAGKLPSGGKSTVEKPTSNAFVAAFDGAGKALWSRAFGDGKSATSAAAVAADAKGNLLVAGSLGGSTSCGDDAAGGTLTSAGDSDVFVAKLRLK